MDEAGLHTEGPVREVSHAAVHPVCSVDLNATLCYVLSDVVMVHTQLYAMQIS